MAIQCPNCGTILDDNAAFCHVCGTSFYADNSAPSAYGAQGEYQPPVQTNEPYPAAPSAAQNYPAAPPAKSKKVVPFIIIGVVLAALIFGVLLFFILRSDDAGDKTTASSAGTSSKTSQSSEESDKSAAADSSSEEDEESETEELTEEPTDEPTEEPTEAPEETTVDLSLMAGTYRLIEVSGSESQSVENSKDSITLEVKEDGTADMKVSGVSATQMTFDAKTGKVTLNNAVAPFTFSDNKITIEDSTGKMVFEKE